MDAISCVAIAAFESWVVSRFRLSEALEHGDPANQLDTKQIFWTLLCVRYFAVKYYRIFLYHKYFSPLRHIPGPTDNHPILGQLLNEFRAPSPVSLYTKWRREHPSAPLIRHLSFANAEVLVATSLPAQREILQTQCYSFQKSRIWNRLTRDITGDGISTLEGDAHRAHRRMLVAPFAAANVRKRLGPVLKAKAREFCGLLDGLFVFDAEGGREENRGEGGEDRNTAVITDCVSLFSRATLDIVGIATLGVDLAHLGQTTRVACQPQSHKEKKTGHCTFHKAYEQIFTPDTLGKILLLLNAFLPTRWVPLAGNRRFRTATAWLRTALTELVRERRRDIVEAVAAGVYDGGEARNLLSFLLEESVLSSGSAEGLDEDLIIGDIMTFIGAGSDTPAMTIAWCLSTMIKHPDAQDKLREESTHLVTRSPDPSCAEIDALPYVDVFLKEVLRLYPPSNAVHREAITDLTIEGVYIPKGTNFVIPLQCAGLNTAVWGDDADEFRPSRWEERKGEKDPDWDPIDGNVQHAAVSSSSSPFAFAAFSNGPRICPGKAFALYEIKAILFELVRRYRFLGIEGDFILDNPSLNLRPRGMDIRFERIDI